LTTFGHIMVNSVTVARKHVSIRVRQIMLPCARICFLSAPFYGSSHRNFLTSAVFHGDVASSQAIADLSNHHDSEMVCEV